MYISSKLEVRLSRLNFAFPRRSQQTVMVYVVCAIWGAAAMISIPPLAGWNRYIYEVREREREERRERERKGERGREGEKEGERQRGEGLDLSFC